MMVKPRLYSRICPPQMCTPEGIIRAAKLCGAMTKCNHPFIWELRGIFLYKAFLCSEMEKKGNLQMWTSAETRGNVSIGCMWHWYIYSSHCWLFTDTDKLWNEVTASTNVPLFGPSFTSTVKYLSHCQSRSNRVAIVCRCSFVCLTSWAAW